MTDHEKLIKLVEQMRTAQKEYFRSRSGASLSKSKELERKVDTEVRNFKNPNLFN